MNGLGKMMALVLLLVVVSPVALAYGRSQTMQPGSAACHEHGHKVPAPSPGTYQCCRGGHQFAAVREPVNLWAASVLVERVVEFGASSAAEVVCRARLRPLDLGSADVRTLRI